MNNKTNKKKDISSHIIIFIMIVLCVTFIFKSSAFLFQAINNTTKSIGTQTKKIIANTIGKEMKKDSNGNINMLLIGYGGAKRAGGFLSDSMIIASFDPEEFSVSMLSIPRDLVINASGNINRINTVMAFSYNKHKDLDIAAKALSKKLEEMTSINTPYYALIDFNGFSELIDKVGGLDVYVPKKVYDSTYPGPNYSYTTFSINSGQQHLDGVTALKYARSRHSSSDFSRSQRQQLILKGLLEKLTQKGISIDTMKELYTLYTTYIHSNITLDEILGLIAYGRSIPKIHSFGLTNECGDTARKTMSAGCFLSSVDSSQFGGMAGLLPVGAGIGKISYYDPIRAFSNIITHNQEFLNEEQSIHIYNATDKTYAKKFSYKDKIAEKLGSKLKKFGFNVTEINTTDKTSTGTIAIITGTGDYKDTIKALEIFFPIDTIEINPATVDLSGNALSNSIDIYIGNNFLDLFGKKPFNFYLPYAQ